MIPDQVIDFQVAQDTRVEGNTTQILPLIPGDHDLDPLRARADFRDLMADVAFPRDPFAGPSPLSRSVPETLGTSDADGVLAKRAEGHRLLAAGRTREGLPLLVSALASEPDDSSSAKSLLIEVAALQAWFGQDAQLAATCRRALESARDTTDPTTAERTAKICCLRSTDDRAILDPTLALARHAVELGKDHPYLPYFQMALGMAEYRSGNYTAADAALLAASEANRGNPLISGTSAFYRAMSLFRQGKGAEARRIAAEAVSQMRPLPADEDNPLTGGTNADDLILWMAFKEARALLKLDADPDSRAKLEEK
jgi:tetratricopeptide (TPR) repeat protein